MRHVYKTLRAWVISKEQWCRWMEQVVKCVITFHVTVFFDVTPEFLIEMRRHRGKKNTPKTEKKTHRKMTGEREREVKLRPERRKQILRKVFGTFYNILHTIPSSGNCQPLELSWIVTFRRESDEYNCFHGLFWWSVPVRLCLFLFLQLIPNCFECFLVRAMPEFAAKSLLPPFQKCIPKKCFTLRGLLHFVFV